MKNTDFSLHPTVWEVIQAEKVFREHFTQHIHEEEYPVGNPLHSSRETIIKCALAKVWTAGRRYQMQYAGNNTRQTHPATRKDVTNED